MKNNSKVDTEKQNKENRLLDTAFNLFTKRFWSSCYGLS